MSYSQTIISALLSAIMLMLTQYLLPQSTLKIATVNVNAIINSHIQTMGSSNLDNRMIEKNMTLFVKQLEREIEEVSKEKKVVLFLHEAVLKGVPDYTDIVLKRTQLLYQQDLKNNNFNHR